MIFLRLQTEKLVGYWEGKLNLPNSLSLTMGFRVAEKNGALSATLDVPEQGAKDIAVAQTTLQGNTVTFDLPMLRAKFVGTLSTDGQKIAGTFTQGIELPLTLAKTTTATTFKRPQTPKEPFPYKTEEVSYPNPKAKGVTIAGTLSIPEGTGPFPVALFISGSGPQDRDESLLGHKPFAVIADFLARKGIACLRVDDRGVAKSKGSFATATSADFASDVRAGIAYLQTRSEIHPKAIGLIGHSEGGLIAPMVAADTPTVRFIVLLAGPGVPGDEILLAQSELISKAMGVPAPQRARDRALSIRLYAVAKKYPDEKQRLAALRAAAERAIKKLPPAEQKEARKNGGSELQTLASPWFYYFLTYDPRPTLRKVRCPVLALNGTKDLQVPVEQNLPAIRAALAAGGNTHVTTVALPNLNHLFQHCKTGAPTEYAKIEETFSPDALEKIAGWIQTLPSD